jgi:hypothetical protein
LTQLMLESFEALEKATGRKKATRKAAK